MRRRTLLRRFLVAIVPLVITTKTIPVAHAGERLISIDLQYTPVIPTAGVTRFHVTTVKGNAASALTSPHTSKFGAKGTWSQLKIGYAKSIKFGSADIGGHNYRMVVRSTIGEEHIDSTDIQQFNNIMNKLAFVVDKDYVQGINTNADIISVEYIQVSTNTNNVVDEIGMDKFVKIKLSKEDVGTTTSSAEAAPLLATTSGFMSVDGGVAIPYESIINDRPLDHKISPDIYKAGTKPEYPIRMPNPADVVRQGSRIVISLEPVPLPAPAPK